MGSSWHTQKRKQHENREVCRCWPWKCEDADFENWSDLAINQGMGFPGESDGKESACNAGDPGWILGSGRSPGEGNSNPLQHSCLGNPMDRGAWRATVHGVTKDSDMTEWLTLSLSYFPKEGGAASPSVTMASHGMSFFRRWCPAPFPLDSPLESNSIWTSHIESEAIRI